MNASRRAVLAALLLEACGTSGNGPASSGTCPQGTVFCTTCGSDGVCTAGGCPNISCPSPGDAASDASAGTCPAGQFLCPACNGSPYCAAGGCSVTTCPVAPDAGVDATQSQGAACRLASDCRVGTACTSPVQSIPYPASAMRIGGFAGGCDADVDCAPDGGNLLCETHCGGNCSNSCISGCSGGAYPCPEGSTCGASHRCEASACSGPSGCPVQFDCVQGFCARRGCQKDSDCAASGYCVLGQCSTDLGTCLPQTG